MEQDHNTSLFQLNLDAQNSFTLRSAATWAKVLGVVGIMVGVIFIILAATTLSQLGQYAYSSRSGGMNMFGSRSLMATKTGLWLFLITGLIFVLGGIFSFSFGNKVGQGLKTSDQQGLNNGFAALRNYYALRSIVLIIVLLFLFLLLANTV